MRLDTVALVIVVVLALLWLGVMIAGIIAAPFGIAGLIPLAVVLGLLIVVVYQRLNNAEDDHYDRTVDK